METLRIGCAAWAVGFYRTIKPRFSGVGLNSDTGLFPDRGLDETVRFIKSQAIDLFDFHTESDMAQHKIAAHTLDPTASVQKATGRVLYPWGKGLHGAQDRSGVAERRSRATAGTRLVR